MASKGKQTDLSRFPSKYAHNTYVTTQQYIIELICSRQAAFNKKELPLYFWKDNEWASIYKRWLRIVHKLSKEYSAKAILHALQDQRAKYKWSLNTDFMLNLIKEHQEKLEQEKNNMAEMKPIEVAEGNTFRESGIVNEEIKKLIELD